MSLKKIMSVRVVLLITILSVVLFTGLHTDAAEIPQNTAKTALYYGSLNSKKATVDLTVDVNESERYEVGLFLPGNANPIQIKTVSYGYNRVRFDEMKRNQVYYYAIRKIESTGGLSVYPISGTPGPWSKKKAFVCPIYSVKALRVRGDSRPVFVLKIPKIKGVKKFKVYTCQKANGKYRYIGSTNPGKKQKVKLKSKKKIPRSYFRLIPVLKNKITCASECPGYRYNFWYQVYWR